jgi:hypothetical protein
LLLVAALVVVELVVIQTLLAVVLEAYLQDMQVLH